MKILSTQNYTLFKRIPGNRAVSQPHVHRLLEAIKDDPETITYNPIIVNEDFEVIDGQHRLEAIKKLQLPIHYVKVNDLTLGTVQRLNSLSKMWSPTDYAKSFAENGNDYYRIYLDFKNEFKFNHDVLMRYLALDQPMTGTLFKNGKFVAPDPAKSYEYCVYLRDVANYYERAKQRNSALGLLMVMRSPKYDHKRLIRQLSKHGQRVTEQALAQDYAREYERIFNFHLHNPIRLY